MTPTTWGGLTEYAGHDEQLGWVSEAAEERRLTMLLELEEAFAGHVEVVPMAVISFADMDEIALAGILIRYPKVVKPLVDVCNVAGRAIKRDLNFDLNTYSPRLTQERALSLASYLKRHLPAAQSVDALAAIDMVHYRDKEMRRIKGGWEKLTLDALNRLSTLGFAKRKFSFGSDWFELDAASPVTGGFDFGIDVKRVEASLDIHKRGDEIVNKAEKFKASYPNGRFGSVVYYPFPDDHEVFSRRNKSEWVDSLVFAASSQDSVDVAVLVLMEEMGIPRR